MTPSPIDRHLQTVLSADIPHSLEAEEAVLGAVLVNPSAFTRIALFLKAEDFYFLKCAYIWQAFNNLVKRNDPIDYLTVVQELKTLGWLDECGGQPYLTKLVTETPTSIHAEVYGHMVERAATRRNLLAATDRIREYALNDNLDVNEVIRQSQDDFLKVLTRTVQTRGIFLNRGLDELLSDMERTANDPHYTPGIPTGYKHLDDMLGGLDKQDLTILAARPGTGKSALLICMALNMAKAGFKVGLYPNEMSRLEIIRRIVAIETGVNSQQMRRSRQLSSPQWAAIYEQSGRVYDLPLFIDDAILTPGGLRISAKWLKSIGSLDVILFDGIYSASADSGVTREYERLSEIAQSLKDLSRELDIPIVATHQLNRDFKNRQDKHPVLSDLKGSGKLEDIADMVWFLYRDALFNPATEFPNQAELIVAKNRDGATGAISLFFERSLTKFMDASVRQVSLREKIQGKSIPEYEED